MKRLLIVLAGCAALFAVAPGQAQARECGLPDKTPVWVDFADGSVPYWPMFARPGVVAAAANFIFPPQLRALGAQTVYWEMHLRQRVGTPDEPARPGRRRGLGRPYLLPRRRVLGLRDAVDRAQRDVGLEPRHTLVADERAVPAERDHLRPAPEALGAHPFVLLSTRPFTDVEAGDWWREAALYTDFVREIYFASPQLSHAGPILASRTLRNAFRRGITDLTEIGIPPSKIGIFLGFHTSPDKGSRGGLKPASAWFDTDQAPGARGQAGEPRDPLRDASGPGAGASGSAADRDPDKPAAACVYLWTRDHGLCAGPAHGGAQVRPRR